MQSQEGSIPSRQPATPDSLLRLSGRRRCEPGAFQKTLGNFAGLSNSRRTLLLHVVRELSNRWRERIWFGFVHRLPSD